MHRPIVCYVTDRRSLEIPADRSREAALIERIRTATSAGADWIQLREKDLKARSLFDLGCAAIAASHGTAAQVLINDRLDVAWACGAAGVHLGESSVPVGEVVRAKREIPRRDFVVGASCHSLEASANAARDGADYIFFGPVFATPSKAEFGAPQGLTRLAEVCRAVPVAVLAIGGVTSQNARECLQAGAAGIAAIRLFQDGADLAATLRKIR
jgi:thiamine-phosphate pyrophosphorylase